VLLVIPLRTLQALSVNDYIPQRYMIMSATRCGAVAIREDLQCIVDT